MENNTNQAKETEYNKNPSKARKAAVGLVAGAALLGGIAGVKALDKNNNSEPVNTDPNAPSTTIPPSTTELEPSLVPNNDPKQPPIVEKDENGNIKYYIFNDNGEQVEVPDPNIKNSVVLPDGSQMEVPTPPTTTEPQG